MNKNVLLIVCLFYSLLSISQRVIVPVEYNPEQAAEYANASLYRTTAVGDTLSLPIFDDFTQSNINPDPSIWESNGGTYINNNYPVNPPNYNVATFDGLAANGIPYNTTNSKTKGSTDKLVSKPINLSNLTIGDSLYLRFYWQSQGLGEMPDTEDSIQLLIKNQSGVFKRVWSTTGGQSNEFQHQVIRIGDAAQYFHDGFQFQFQAYGRQYASYDIWNLDYIYLDTGRLAKANWFPDISFSNKPSSFLKNYTAMPITQYLADKNNETATNVDVTIVSRNDKLFYYKIEDTTSFLEDILNNTRLDTIPKIASTFIEPFTSVEINWQPDPSVITSSTKKILKYSFVLGDRYGLDPDIDTLYEFTGPDDKIKSKVDFNKNNTVSGYTYLTDYYSYDDGSAEFGFGITEAQGKIAVEYTLNSVPDTLTYIDIYFPRIGAPLGTESINISVWESININGKGENLLYAETVLPKHSSSLNEFQMYKLETPVIITSPTFYVGFQQNSNKTIYAGFDKSKDNRTKTFYNVQGTWKQEDFEEGSLMIRPVFGVNRLITGIQNPDNKYTELECEIYPNPSDGNLYIAGKVAMLHIYDLSGKLLLNKTYDGITEDIKEENISHLPNGFYLLHLENGNAKVVKKLVVSH